MTQTHVAAVLWLVAIATLAGGYSRIEAQDAGRLAALTTEGRQLELRIGRAERIVRRSSALRAARKRIVDDIRAQASPANRSEFGAMLAALDRSARRSGLAILELDPERGTTGRAPDPMLSPKDVKLVLRGSFQGFLAFLSSFSREDPLVALNGVTIAPVGSAQRDRLLSFAIAASSISVRPLDEGV